MGTNLAFPTLDKAISNFEGFGTPQASTITLANNPGALAPASWEAAYGASSVPMYTASGQPVAVFPSVEAGTSAEDALVGSYANSGLSIADLINKWSPSNAPGNSPTGTNNYINSVAAAMQATPQTSALAAEQAYDLSHGVTNVTGAPGQTPPPVTTPGSSGSSGTTLGGILGNIWSGDPLGLNKIGPAAPTAPDLSAGRIAAFILGLILIAVGLWMFKPVQQVVATGRRAGELLAA